MRLFAGYFYTQTHAVIVVLGTVVCMGYTLTHDQFMLCVVTSVSLLQILHHNYTQQSTILLKLHQLVYYYAKETLILPQNHNQVSLI